MNTHGDEIFLIKYVKLINSVVSKINISLSSPLSPHYYIIVCMEVNKCESIILLYMRYCRNLVNEYVCAVRKLACEVLEMIADELGIGAKDALSRLIRDEESDSCFRINHYPPRPDDELDKALLSGEDLIGFGEHTDPQLISVVKSNNASGLQICLRDGTWASVPPDHTSFFFSVGDSLQVVVCLVHFI